MFMPSLNYLKKGKKKGFGVRGMPTFMENTALTLQARSCGLCGQT